MKNLKTMNTTKKSQSALVVAKVLALVAFGVVMLLLASEVMAVCTYGIPLLVVQIAQMQGVGTGADWVIGGTLWFFPSLFLVLMIAWAHTILIRKIMGRMWKFVCRVMKKSVEND